jgi:glycosyltransferase involved in cell wall biosynthesis
MNEKQLNLFSPIGHTGYGITSANIAKALYYYNVDLYLFLIGKNIYPNNEEEKVFFSNLINKAKNFPYYAPSLKIWHQFDLATSVGKGDYYAYPFFELDKFPENEIHMMNYADYVFATSKWAKTVLLNNGIKKPIYIAPLGVDAAIFKPPIKIKFEQNNYIFFNIGKFEKRKSQDFIIEAFSKAFTKSDNVELRLIPQFEILQESQKKDLDNAINSSPLKDKIKLYNRLPTQYDVANFIWSGDCGLYLSRAEGWNNEILETMALNKPVIVSNYSAHTEYCTEQNSLLVDIDELELAQDGVWFHGNSGKWAKLGQNQLDQTIEHMKYVYSNNIRTNTVGLETVKNYSWLNTGKIIYDTISSNGSFYANPKKKKRRR